MATRNSCKITLLLPPPRALNAFGGPSKRAVDIHSIKPPGLLNCPKLPAKQTEDCLRGGGGNGWATIGRAWIEKTLARFLPRGGGGGSLERSMQLGSLCRYEERGLAMF